MNAEDRTKVELYLRNQLSQADKRLDAYTKDRNNKPYVRRCAALKLTKYLRDFQKMNSEPRWIVVPGLRGVGKTTLLAQLYTELKCKPQHKLYISLDEAKRVLGVDLTDILSIYEEVLGTTLEKLTEPIFLFIDEAQYEPNWGLVLKSLYDRSKKIFIFCTGSSALSLQTNPDVSRRAVFEKLFPLSFTEYMLLKERKYPISGLGNAIKLSLFDSDSGEELYIKLEKLKKSVATYWSTIDRLEIDKYLQYGTLPFTLQLQDETLINNQIEQTLTNVQTKDIPQLSKFDQETISKIGPILYAIATSEVSSLKKLATSFNLSINTLVGIFEILGKSEILLRIYPQGSHFGQTKKPSKYLFHSPAYRSMFFNLIGSTYDYDNYKGKLLEDAVGMYLSRTLGLKFGSALTYDSAENGADFIISFHKKRILVEVGYGKKSFGQVLESMKRIPSSYSISISPNRLKLSGDKKNVLVPVSYFLLI
jgi:predicted AAA+ superfamily ATPase